MPPLLAAIGIGAAATAGTTATAGGIASLGAATIGSTAASAALTGTIAGATTAAVAGAGVSTTSLITAGLTALSGVTSAVGSYAQGKYQQEAGAAQAQEETQQANLVKQQAGAEIATQDYKAMNILGKMAAATAGSGVTPEGSPNVVQNTSRQEQNISDMYTKYSGQLQSMQDLYKAAIAKKQGEEQSGAGIIGAGGGLLTAGLTSYGVLSGNFAVPYIGG